METTKKLLTIFPSTHRGGTEEYALTIASAAAQCGWDVHAAFPKTDRTTTLIRDFIDNRVSYHSLRSNNSIKAGLLSLLKIYLKTFLGFIGTVLLLNKLKPDVIQINLPYPTLCQGSILACNLFRIPTVIVFHCIPDKICLSDQEQKFYAWMRSKNQIWVACSEFNRRLVYESFQADPSEVIRIYNGIKVKPVLTTGKPEELEELRCQVREELGVPATSRLALTVGRLDPAKGYNDLIPIISPITKEFSDVKFVWVGSGEKLEKDNLKHQLQAYSIEDKFLFLGYRSDIPRLLKAADLFVFPTHFEGPSLALLEAMAYGLPVVISDAATLPEIVTNNVHGLMFKTKDSQDLLENLRRAFGYPEKMQEMAQAATLRSQDFSEDNMVHKMLAIFDESIQFSNQ
ncbi:MAG: glycosyltransferase family 4 protein [Symploca sp. SIO2G7]|nr:glycosyltransferase family 4 protein [Symploca sp. SIO2G7]